ncbi:RICIN domain-containing protein [Streptomyces sp. NPDC048242]|uniref:RICIN domain-containing protein n=1 Tax=Streptomyces sp. NPDC048242 TaxID=3155026 RepID=UPI00343AE0F9
MSMLFRWVLATRSVPLLLVAAVLALLGARPEPSGPPAGVQPVADSYDGFDAKAAQQVREDQCRMAGVLRLGGPTMYGIAQSGLNQPADGLHTAADPQYWNDTPLAKGFKQDRDLLDKAGDAQIKRVNSWKISGLSYPGGFKSVTDFEWPPGIPDGEDFFDQTGLTKWAGDQWWRREGDFYEDPTPPADEATVKAVRDLGTPLYGADPDPQLPTPQWQQAYEEHEAWQRLVDWSSEPTGADNARLFLSSGGFARTAPEPGSLEFRIAVEDLKTRFAACAWRTPVDPNMVLGKEVSTASEEWQREIAGQAAQRNQILDANRDATKALADGATSLGEMLGQSWVADHLTRWQDYWSAGGPGWIGDSPMVVHVHAASDKCLEVGGGKKDNGTPVQIYTCNGSAGQKWTIRGDSLVNVNSGKCLDVKSGSTANGTAVQIQTCATRASQQWTYGTHGTTGLRNQGLGKCLDLQDYANSRDARIWDCKGTDPQKFDMTPSGHNGTDQLDYPTKAQFDQATKGVSSAQAEAKKQLDLIKSRAAAAKKDATTTDTALQASYTIADQQGAPRGRALLAGQQKAQVTKASAAALDAMAKAGETAYAATRAAASDSRTIAARAVTEAAASKAAFRTAAAQAANEQAKAAADAVAVQAKNAKDARDTARAKLAETQKAEADAKAAAATAHAKRLAAEAEEKTAKAEKETAAAKRAEAAGHRKSAEGYASAAKDAQDKAEAAESTARGKREDAEAARDRAKDKRDDAWDAKEQANAARAKADAKDAYADAHESDADAQDARAAADQADKAADDAESAAASARTEADAATKAAADADAAATRAEAAAGRARADADAAKAAKLKADAAVRAATSAAADAIKASQSAADSARAAVRLADEAKQHAADSRKQADAARAEAAKALAGSADAAGHAHVTAQAAEDAHHSAQQVATPANDAIQLGSPYVTTDSAAGLAVLIGQSSKSIAEQQQAVADAHAANAQKAAEQAKSTANAASGDAKAAYTIAAEAAGHAADAQKSAKEALGYAAEAAKAAADAQTSLADTIEYDRQAGVDAGAADGAAGRAEGYAKDARDSADQAELDADAARSAASDAEQSAKDARAAADRADAEATKAEEAAKDAQKYADSAQEAYEQAQQADANKQVQTGASTGVGGVFSVIDEIKPRGEPERLPNECHGLDCNTLVFVAHFDAVVSYYLCLDPDVPATEAGCPSEDTVFLTTKTISNLSKTVKVSAWDVTEDVWKGIFKSIIGDFTGCYHKLNGDGSGSYGDCAWAATWLPVGGPIAKITEAIRGVDAALRTGVGVSDAMKALRALDIDAATLSRIESTVRVYEDARTACPLNSFPGDTRVLMADGSRKAIRYIREGDLLLAAEPGTDGLRPEPVTDAFSHHTGRLTDIGVAGSVVTSTPGHRFYVAGQGWVTVSELAVGDLLRTSDGTLRKVTSLHDRPVDERVFDLTVDGLHTFFVRTRGKVSEDVLVHNCLNIVADEGTGGAHTLTDHVRPDDRMMAAKANDTQSGIATRWTDEATALRSVNEAFQQWIARNPRGLDGWLSKMRNKFGKNGDRGYFDPRTDLKQITWTLADKGSLGRKWVRNGPQNVEAGNKVVIQLRYVGKPHPSGYVVYSAYLAG